MSEHAGDENQPTTVRSAFTFSASAAIRRGLLLGDVHQPAHNRVDGLAALLEHVDERVLAARRIVVAILAPTDAPRRLARVGRPVVHRAAGLVAPQHLKLLDSQQLRLLGQRSNLGAALTPTLRLRLARLGIEHRHVDCEELQLAVGAALREDGAQPLVLHRLSAVRQVAAALRLVGQQVAHPLGGLQLVELPHRRAQLLGVRLAEEQVDLTLGAHTLAVDASCLHLDRARRHLDAKRARGPAEDGRQLLARDTQLQRLDAGAIHVRRDVPLLPEEAVVRLCNRPVLGSKLGLLLERGLQIGHLQHSTSAVDQIGVRVTG